MTDDDTSAERIDSRAFRNALAHYGSGITVVTGLDGDTPVGFTCQAFYSVSMEPPLVSISVMRTSTTYPRLRRTGRFAINILAEDQAAVASQFGRSGIDKWSGIERSTTPTGMPVIDDALVWIDCKRYAEHEAGDHIIVVASVLGLRQLDGPARMPLVFYRGAYGRLIEHRGG
ncbi:MAG: flavin reductase family protein [Microbacteriaceae bacterium]